MGPPFPHAGEDSDAGVGSSDFLRRQDSPWGAITPSKLCIGDEGQSK